MRELDGKIALVAWASKGIGARIALSLAKEGAAGGDHRTLAVEPRRASRRSVGEVLTRLGVDKEKP
jgi:NAD(P)-dependent dehydrogenase (short-subunit alcohol dehydrogenase family)